MTSRSSKKYRTERSGSLRSSPRRTQPSSLRRPRIDEITFTNADHHGSVYPHHDALVISLFMANCLVRKILIDNGSSSNIIFLRVLRSMGMADIITKRSVTIVGFSGEKVNTVGEVTLPICIEGMNLRVEFEVIDAPSMYNAILGRPWLHELGAIPSTYHQVLKLPTPWGVKTIRGDQKHTGDRYEASFRQIHQTNITRSES